MNHPAFVLLVDDDDEDVQILQTAFETTGAPLTYQRAKNGEDAMVQLRAMQQRGTLPGLVVMDINMPRTDGRETLMAIQADAALHHIPVVMYTTSSSPIDKLFFNHRKVPFFTKPYHFRDIVNAANAMLAYLSNGPSGASKAVA